MKNILKVFGIIALSAVVVFSLISCNDGGESKPGQAAQASSVYTWTDNGDTFELTITEPARSNITAGNYILRINGEQISSGTATVVDGGGIKLSGTGVVDLIITIISDTKISISDGATITFDGHARSLSGIKDVELVNASTGNGLSVTNEQVYLCNQIYDYNAGYSTFTYTPFSGSGTVYGAYMNPEIIFASQDENYNYIEELLGTQRIGRINSGKLTFTLPAAPPARAYIDFNELINWPLENYTDEYGNTTTYSNIKGKINATNGLNIAFAEIYFKDNDEPDEEKWVYYEDYTDTNTVSQGYYMMYIYADKNGTVKGTRSYTYKYTSNPGQQGSYTHTSNDTESFDVTLVRGWNIIYCYYSDNYNNNSNNATSTYNMSITSARPSGASNMKWNIFGEYESINMPNYNPNRIAPNRQSFR